MKHETEMAVCAVCGCSFEKSARKDKTICSSSCFHRKKSCEKHGYTPEQYADMLAIQGQRCAICGIDFKTTCKIQLDHCHKTGKIRGLLCANCNFMLGNAKYSTSTLLSAVTYLLAAEKNNRQ
jgi:hypothetical protein